jgi:hypothetical protein
VLRRVIASAVLVSLAAAPAVARTRFFCRYTGVEITDCAEGQVPAVPEVQNEGCCDRRVTPSATAMLSVSHDEIQPPVLVVLLVPIVGDGALPALVADRVSESPSASATPIFLITRALLI